MKTLASIFLVIVIFIFGKAISQISDEISGFIVNGRDADIADFPHHLGLFNRGSFICGAAVINPLFALTAAHCLDFGTPTADTFMGWIDKSSFWRSSILCQLVLFASAIH